MDKLDEVIADVDCILDHLIIALAMLAILSLLLTGCSQEAENPYADIELNPCPMCGGQVVVNDYRYGYWISCDNCMLHTGNYESLDELVKTWNGVESEVDNGNDD